MQFTLGYHQTELFPEASTDGAPLFNQEQANKYMRPFDDLLRDDLCYTEYQMTQSQLNNQWIAQVTLPGQEDNPYTVYRARNMKDCIDWIQNEIKSGRTAYFAALDAWEKRTQPRRKG